ncbi:hypothetical protein, partial [Bacteroides ovatus]|uniref:hypothetical protein n=1 Tax=Bacteroides ovatus TaxID=28116 RepID=UPI001E285E52
FDQWTMADNPDRTTGFKDLIVYRLAGLYYRLFFLIISMAVVLAIMFCIGLNAYERKLIINLLKTDNRNIR